MSYSVEDIKWFAENARRQRSGPMSVWRMADAHEWFCSDERWATQPSEIIILGVAVRVDPGYNHGGYRHENVRIGQYVAPDWQEVPRLVEQLVREGIDLSPDDWYREFEEIHPFRDGNGRTGAILWNGALWRRDNGISSLRHPPDFFDRNWFNN